MAHRDIPQFSHPIVETHCHLDYLKEHSVEEALRLSQAVGVEKFITIAVSPDNLDTALQMASEHEGVYCSQGIHPHEAKGFSPEIEEKIVTNAQQEMAVAVGEIGLDFHYNLSPKEKQFKAFKQQLELACRLELPVIIHSREADTETKDILEAYAPRLKRKGVIHCFSAGKQLAHTAVSLGFYLGLGGILTFKNAEGLREVVRSCPLENIVLETDAPYLAPVPYRGKENAPFYLPFIAEKIAQVKEVSVEAVLETAYKNSQKLFRFP